MGVAQLGRSFGTRACLSTVLHLNFIMMTEVNHWKESDVVRISFRKRAIV